MRPFDIYRFVHRSLLFVSARLRYIYALGLVVLFEGEKRYRYILNGFISVDPHTSLLRMTPPYGKRILYLFEG